MMKVNYLISWLAASVFVLSACSSNQTVSTDATETQEQEEYALEDVKNVEPVDARSSVEQALWDRRQVFFDFDRSMLTAQSKDLIAEHVQYLSSHPDLKIRLEGHADERGTREYNLALGEQRAKAVRQFLLQAGISQDQVDIISYGEELPVEDHAVTESSHASNRRVEFHYLGGELASAPLSYEKNRITREQSEEMPAAGPSPHM